MTLCPSASVPGVFILKSLSLTFKRTVGVVVSLSVHKYLRVMIEMIDKSGVVSVWGRGEHTPFPRGLLSYRSPHRRSYSRQPLSPSGHRYQRRVTHSRGCPGMLIASISPNGREKGRGVMWAGWWGGLGLGDARQCVSLGRADWRDLITDHLRVFCQLASRLINRPRGREEL